MQTIDLTGALKEKTENHTSKGDQPKWHMGDKWFKADYMGYEALSEYAVSKLLEKSNAKEFVKYDLIKIKYGEKERVGCVCKNFRDADEMLVPLEKLHRQYFGRGLADALSEKTEIKDKIIYTADFVEQTTGLKDFGKYLTLMLSVDAFFLNEDRHTNNIAVLRNEKTKKFRTAPLFDHGLALLSDSNDYPYEKDVYENIGKVRAKPFDTSFDKQLNAAEEIYGVQLKLYFTKNDIYKVRDELKEYYYEKTVNRAEKILLEQMRKYRCFFEG